MPPAALICAAVSFSGFPQTYIGKFRACPVPVLAFYGSADPLIPQTMVERLRGELRASALRDQHQVVTLDGAGHELFPEEPTDAERDTGARVWTDDHASILPYVQWHNVMGRE